MSEELKLKIAILVSDVIMVVVFAVLAVLFRHWWISLFSILFLTTNKKEKNKEEGKDHEQVD